MRWSKRNVCEECGEELTPNSAVFDDWGTPNWQCSKFGEFIHRRNLHDVSRYQFGLF